MPTTDQEFSSIRAYTDADLPIVLPQLRKDKRLLDILAGYRLKRLHNLAPWLARWLLRLVLGYKLTGVRSIFALQEKITGYYFFHMIESSVDDIAISGLDNLPERGGALLLSNHRDIVLDPIFVDYALYTKRRATARLATGDNLMHIPFAEHLMRLNKSFLVKRGETSPRKLLANLKTLSRYIRQSIIEDAELVWLAQREGRAKNGLDRTEVAVLKMLKLADKRFDWQATCAQLHIIPVSIAYEYDPCDLAKATELCLMASTGTQHKDDTASVVTSIHKNKGRVAIHFGQALHPTADASVEELARAIDRQIVANYRLFPSNYISLALLANDLGGDYASANRWFAEQGKLYSSDERFAARLAAITDKSVRLQLLQIYANPCVERWRHTTSQGD